ncbi:tumor necrosis factor ligand superfamily member 6-like [Biomphalaria glabrata]|uniref:Tumor necrosis factor ligand superfamily member 6-like n=1 Tax=Biomphalaria glabrata TaxID=6526 RepID=A0A9W2YY97_BIOGL|nr:tumor necrosis factor ligand superfamily member 6-like [Biomphalaria glabrata]XP_055867747.1 tumor necrosis factor ligand superfamily member 6-like [Biomphalaria glabrata]
MPWMFKKTKRLLLPISSVAFVVSLVALVLAIILGNKNPDKPVTNLKYNDIMQIVGKVCYSTAQNDSLLAQEADVTPSNRRVVSAHVTLRPYGLNNSGCHPDLNKPRNDVSSSEETCNRPLALNLYLDKDYEHAENIIVTSECLTLKYSGLYYVYACVYFKPHISHCAMNMTPPLDMKWQVSTKSGLFPHLQTVLFSGVVTCLRSCSEFEKSSFSGRNFLLNVNDTLFVEVSDDSVVNFDKTSSYLGAHRLVENKRFKEQLTNVIDNEEF